MPKTFCVVGHDARQQAAARVLRRAGYGVTAADNAAAADYILLPMSQGRVSDEVARALQGAGQGTLILAGRPGMPVRMAAREAGLPLIDYFLRPELECLNAVPAPSGCQSGPAALSPELSPRLGPASGARCRIRHGACPAAGARGRKKPQHRPHGGRLCLAAAGLRRPL